MSNEKKSRSKKTTKESLPSGQGQGEEREPQKQKNQPTTRVMWITVLFNNGERYKIPAKVIARRMAELKKVSYDEVIYDGEALIKFANEYMTWVDVSMSAHKYTLDTLVDYVDDWKSADKDIIREPVPAKEKAPDPNKKPDFVTAKQEDAEMGSLEDAPDGAVVDLD